MLYTSYRPRTNAARTRGARSKLSSAGFARRLRPECQAPQQDSRANVPGSILSSRFFRPNETKLQRKALDPFVVNPARHPLYKVLDVAKKSRRISGV
jgi:hypothetical protein